MEKSRATTDDITKMHAYRDAIDGVTAALVLYPGANGYLKTPDRESRRRPHIDDLIDDIIAGNLDGIGAIPMSPIEKGTESSDQPTGTSTNRQPGHSNRS